MNRRDGRELRAAQRVGRLHKGLCSPRRAGEKHLPRGRRVADDRGQLVVIHRLAAVLAIQLRHARFLQHALQRDPWILPVETRVDALDALCQRRVRGEETKPARFHASQKYMWLASSARAASISERPAGRQSSSAHRKAVRMRVNCTAAESAPDTHAAD